MAFSLSKKSSISYSDPEKLFADNKKKRIKGLLSYQADIIRNYLAEGLDKTDVSIQLPTGAGKTLIGSLIGDWLRQTRNERVLYLCPNNQLVNQVSKQLTYQYGIDNTIYTGSKSNYTSEMRQSYYNCECISIISYSSLFNVNPFFKDANIIILDDVHQAENYINSLWTVKIRRDEESTESIYEELFSFLQGCLSKSDFYKILKHQDADNQFVDKLPGPIFYTNIENIIKIIENKINATSQKFSWEMIKDHLSACHFYYSINEIMIKPLYPPTVTFDPFNSAKQRIYMSATIGNGGDLERIVGRRSIAKINTPPEMKDRTVGRRFFYFPSINITDEEKIIEFNKQVSLLLPRSLYIVPNMNKLEMVVSEFKKINNFKIFLSKDVEEDKEVFTSENSCMLLLANRYDGIDFPDDECRLIFIDGLPRALNLQEQFFIKKLGLNFVFQAKIITRVTQAFGRTTRNVNDYSVVFVMGEEILSYLFKQETRSLLLPELRAEIELGIDQARSSDLSNVLDNIKIFLKQDNDWMEVDKYILDQRNKFTKEELPNSADLLDIVKNEIMYNESMWYQNYSEALSECKNILGKLTPSSLRGLRGLWNYFAGNAVYLLKQSEIDVGISQEYYYEMASKGAVAVSWLNQLKHEAKKTQSEAKDELLYAIIDRMEFVFDNFGKGNSFKIDKYIEKIKVGISIDESTSFERAQQELGYLLGYESGNREDEGAPDPWWIVNDNFCIIFEDYSDSLKSSELSVKKARQALSHNFWALKNLPLKDNAEIYVFIVGKIEKCREAALPYLDKVAFWETDNFREWTTKSLLLIKELWNDFPGVGDMFWREMAYTKIKEAHYSPIDIKEKFENNIASERLK
jgi:hypothetical protein